MVTDYGIARVGSKPTAWLADIWTEEESEDASKAHPFTTRERGERFVRLHCPGGFDKWEILVVPKAAAERKQA